MDKRFSDIWKEYLQECKSMSGAYRDAYELYSKKYARDDRENPRAESVKSKLCIPGKIYTFLYVTEQKPSSSIPFINRRPVLLSMGQTLQNDKIYEMGIDLMLVPPKIRIFMLESLQKFFKNDIQQNMMNISEGRDGTKALQITYLNAKRMFSKLGWQKAFKVYDPMKMAKKAIYDYSDWVTVVPLFTKSIEGQQIESIYENYVKHMKSDDLPRLDAVV